jgi:uncharacterized cupredoxin-like copper-binding protein
MRLSHRAGRLLVFGTMLAPLGLAACGGSGYGGSASPSTTATTSASAAGAAGGASGHQLTAAESEYKIVLSASTVKPGTYRIEAVNNGSIDHALEIDGPGISAKQTGTISPGSSAVLTVKLQQGTYDVFCPLPGHKALGMDTKLTVS